MTIQEKITAAIAELNEMTIDRFVKIAPQGWIGESPLCRFIASRVGAREDEICEVLPGKGQVPYVFESGKNNNLVEYQLPAWTAEFAEKFRNGQYPNLVEGVPTIDWEAGDLAFLSDPADVVTREGWFNIEQRLVTLAWVLKNMNLFRSNQGLIITKNPVYFMSGALSHARGFNLDLSFNYYRMEIKNNHSTIKVASKPVKCGICRAIFIDDVDIGDWNIAEANHALGKVAIFKNNDPGFTANGWENA